MSGTYRHLGPGRYRLEVEPGQGPAGIRRPDGRDIVVDVEGGVRDFAVSGDEQVYFWWRGPRPRTGVRLTTDPRRVSRIGQPGRPMTPAGYSPKASSSQPG